MRKHYKARDKTVRKMSRDGLMKENLRSGESVNVSRREKDSLTLLERAGDARDRHGNKKTENQKRKRAVDLKKPDSCSTDGSFNKTRKNSPDNGIQQQAAQPLDSGHGKAQSADADGPVKDAPDQTVPDGAGRSFNEKKRRQSAGVKKAREYSADNGIQQQAVQPLDSGHEKAQSADADGPVKDAPDQTVPDGAGRSFNEKKRRQPTGVKRARGNSADNGFQQQAAQPLDSGYETVQAAQSFYDGDEKMQAADSDDTVKDVPGQQEDMEGRVLVRPSRMENVHRHSSKGSGFVSAAAEAGLTRKKRRERPYPQSREREPALSKKKKHDRAYSAKGNGRDSAAERPDKDVQGENAAAAGNRDAAPPENSRDKKRDAPMRERLYKDQRRKLFYYPVRDEGSRAVEMSGNDGREKARQEDHKNQKKKTSRLIFDDKGSRDAAGIPPGMSGDAEKGGQGQKHRRKGQKKMSRLSFDDEGSRMVRGSGMGIAKRAVFLAAHSASDYADGSGQEQERGAADGACKAALARQGAIRYALRPSRRRKLKRLSRLQESRMEKRGFYAEKKDAERNRLRHGPKQGTGKKAAGESGSGTGQAKKDAEKRWQKQRIRRSYQAIRQGKGTAAAAQAAKTFYTKTKCMAMEKLGKNKGIFRAAAVLVLLFAVMSAGMSACGAMLQGAASSIIGCWLAN